MTRTFAAMLVLLAAPLAATAQESGNRSAAACRAITVDAEKSELTKLSDDELKEKMCLSSLSVVRSADPMAAMQCRLAYQALTQEFSRRHPGKEMAEVYGRC